MTRPSFEAAWAAAQEIYVEGSLYPSIKVAEIVGGYVAKNINNLNPEQRWSNTCAVRMSYILNYSGLIIPRISGQTVSGADRKQYFFRVRDIIAFLKKIWGAPEIVHYPQSDDGALLGKKGVILFEVSGWSDAKGHATLFNGSACYDHCYFNEPGVNYRTDQANFWDLS